MVSGAIINLSVSAVYTFVISLYLQCCSTMSLFIQGLSQVVPGGSSWVLWFLENIISPIDPGSQQIFSILAETIVVKMFL